MHRTNYKSMIWNRVEKPQDRILRVRIVKQCECLFFSVLRWIIAQPFRRWQRLGVLSAECAAFNIEFGWYERNFVENKNHFSSEFSSIFFFRRVWQNSLSPSPRKEKKKWRLFSLQLLRSFFSPHFFFHVFCFFFAFTSSAFKCAASFARASWKIFPFKSHFSSHKVKIKSSALKIKSKQQPRWEEKIGTGKTKKIKTESEK